MNAKWLQATTIITTLTTTTSTTTGADAAAVANTTTTTSTTTIISSTFRCRLKNKCGWCPLCPCPYLTTVCGGCIFFMKAAQVHKRFTIISVAEPFCFTWRLGVKPQNKAPEWYVCKVYRWFAFGTMNDTHGQEITCTFWLVTVYRTLKKNVTVTAKLNYEWKPNAMVWFAVSAKVVTAENQIPYTDEKLPSYSITAPFRTAW